MAGAAAWLTLLAGALWLRVLDWSDPWSWRVPFDFRHAFGAFATGGPARFFHEHGFRETSFLPCTWSVSLPSGAVVRELYLHHPALWFMIEGWSLRLFGAHEWALRIPAVAFGLIGLIEGTRLVALVFDRPTAFAFACAFAVLPGAVWDGTQCWSEGAIIALHCTTLRQWLLWHRGGRRGRLAAALATLFVSGLLGWPGLLLAPPLAVHAWLRTRGGSGPSRVRIAALVLGSGAAPAIVHAAHVLAVVPMDEILRELQATWALVRGEGAASTWPAWARMQALHLAGLLTVPGCILAAIGAFAMFRGSSGAPPRREASLLLAPLVAGALNALLFPGRSWDHRFFWLPALPFFAAAIAVALRGAIAWARRRSALAGTAALLAGLAWLAGTAAGDVARWLAHRDDGVREALAAPLLGPALDDPRAVIIASRGRGRMLAFYSRAPIVFDIDELPALEALAARGLDGLERGRTCVFVFDPEIAGTATPLHEHLRRSAPAIRVGTLDVFDLTRR